MSTMVIGPATTGVLTARAKRIFAGEAGTLNVGIYSDAGDVPGTALFTRSTWVPSGGNPTWQGATGINETLSAGTYWIVFSTPTSGGMFGALPDPSSSPLANEAKYNAGSWTSYDNAQLGVRILGTSSVPDPGSSLLLFGIGSGCLAALRRRFR